MKKPGPTGALYPIGIERESSLHRTLKYRYSGGEGWTEARAGDYVCDARTGEGELIEVQTGSFGPLKEKVKNLAQAGKVRIIYPVVICKQIELYDAGGKLLKNYKSPRKGSSWDLFKALLYAPDLPLLENLTIELAMVDILEKRVDDGKGSWRRKGIRVSDRLLSAWREGIALTGPGDYYRFIPFKKKESFTVRDMGKKAGITTILARKCVYVLTRMGLVAKTGKQGRWFVYTVKKL
jgi:hypothetical protein